MFVALDKAIYARLAGEPLDSLGRPKDPSNSPGIQIPLWAKSLKNDPRTAAFNPFDTIDGRVFQVPVRRQAIDGVEWEQVYPSVVFDFISFAPRLDQWLPPVSLNRYDRGGVGPLTQVRDQLGNLVASGQGSRAHTPLPESYDVMLQIDIYGRVAYQVMTVMHAIMLLLPQKGAIRVPQADGSYHTCDVLLKGADKLRAGPPTLEGTGGSQGVEREYRVTMTYNVEAYLDTTLKYMQRTVPTVTDVRLTQTALQSGGAVLETSKLPDVMYPTTRKP